MPVEIAILSGAQQGGRWATDADRVVVGDAETCDICFDGEDPGARGKRGVLAFRDDGWRFENHGSGLWLVNQTSVTPGRNCRLRSGDIVRVSEEGPDLRFTIVTARDYATGLGRAAPSSEKLVPGSACSVAQPGQAVDLADSPVGPKSRLPRFLALTVAAVLLVGLTFGLASWPARNPRPVAERPVPPKQDGPREVAVSESEGDSPGEPVEPKKDAKADSDSSTTAEPDTPRPADPAPMAPDKVSSGEPGGTPDAGAIQAQMAEAMVYLVVEINGQRLPVCCGWAAGPNLVISTGGSIAVLAEVLEAGQPVFAAYGDQNPRFVPVEALVAHPLFDKDQDNAPVSRAHNVGVATLKAPLPKHCELEQAAALPKPPTGMELAVVAYALTTEPDLVPFNALDPPRLRSMLARVAGLEVLSGATNDLPLLRLEVDAPSGMEGSPVFTAEGKVIGVLGGSAANRQVVLCDQLQPLLP